MKAAEMQTHWTLIVNSHEHATFINFAKAVAYAEIFWPDAAFVVIVEED